MPKVPSVFNGIIIVGDMPYDRNAVDSFSNAHYGTIVGLTRKAGLDFNECVQMNVCPHYPDNGKIQPADEPAVQAQLARLQKFCTNVSVRGILLLGRESMRWFKPGAGGVDEERGAPFKWQGIVCIPTYHPRELYMQWKFYNVVLNDFKKLIRLAESGWSQPAYDINYQPTFPECVHFLQWIIRERPLIAMDLETEENRETGQGYFTCCGFAIDGKSAFVIPFLGNGTRHYFRFEEEKVIWRLLAQALEVGRFVGQNAVHYDHWYSAWHTKILLNVTEDTMLASWELYTELPKSLGFLSSIYTDNQYFKNMLSQARSGKIARTEEFRYNGLDNCISLQIASGLAKDLKESPKGVYEHYRFNIRLSRVFQYMSIRGARVNRDLLSTKTSKLEIGCQEAENVLHDLVGFKLNVRSPKQMKDWLYRKLRLPVRYKAVKNDDGSVEDRETADYLTLLYCSREYPEVKSLTVAAKLRKDLKRLSSLRGLQTGPNGEVYWNFNVVGTETGRASGYKPMNGLGAQPQNVDRRDRDLFLPPAEGQVWVKADLEGADSWTVAGQLATLGDDTMLKDLLAGLKPAIILALARLDGEDLITADQQTLAALYKTRKAHLKGAGETVYATAKAVSHGTNYMMQANTMHVTIFRRSEGELFVPVKECEHQRQLYLKRYPGLQKLYNYIPTMLNTDGYLDAPSGMRRVFFGRPDNARTRAALSFLPQNNTAYATNRALQNLFYQPYNRRGNSARLILEPINQVHDEADLAFYENELSSARDIFARATDFTSSIWGIEFKIPFDAEYGADWASCKTPLE